MSMTDAPVENPSGGAEWLLTPRELAALRSTRRLFLAGFIATAGPALAAAVTTAWIVGHAGWTVPRVVIAMAGMFLAAASAWCLGRVRIIGGDIRNARAEMRWGRVARLWRGLRVAEVEGALFPLQATPVPALRPGERVHLRFAPRSRITFDVRTLREVVAAERFAGRPPCPAALADLGETPPARR